MLYPINFPTAYNILHHIVEYRNVQEIAMGGPEVGELFIDNRRVSTDLFGGPLASFEYRIAVPQLTSSFWKGRGFKVAIIDLVNLGITVVGKQYPLILIHSMDKESICFYTDLENQHSGCLSLKSL